MKFSFAKPTLLRRLFTGYVIIIIIITLINSILISRQINKSSVEDIRYSLSLRAQLITEIVRPLLVKQHNTHQENLVSQQKQLQETIDFLARKVESRLTLISPTGVVLADSQEQPALMDNHLNRPEIIDANEKGSGASTRFSHTLQQQMIYFAQAVNEQKENLGYIRLSLSLSTVDDKLEQLKYIILLSALIATLVALVLGFSFFKHFSAPFKKIAEIAESIAQGDYSQRISSIHLDEIGGLISAFNRIAQSSEQRINEIIAERNKLSMIFSGMVEGVIYINEQFEIVHFNKAAENILFAQNDNSSQRNSLSRGHKLKQVEIIEALQEAIAKQDIVKTQMTRRENDKIVQIIDIYVASLNNDMGDANGAVIVLNDISELAYLERVRRDFVANASHELKTPITAIRGLTESILDNPDMDEETRLRFTEKIKTQTLRLSTLITDLMSISRLEKTQKADNIEKFELNRVVKQAVNNAQNLCHQKNLNLTSQICKPLLIMLGDPQEISQLIDNLLHNAINYTPEYGSINVSMSQSSDNQQVIISVSDTGIGIDESYHKRIFERFYRVDKARSRDLGGTGLGLSIAKNIVEKHKGTITVKSKVNHGTTFTIMFTIDH